MGTIRPGTVKHWGPIRQSLMNSAKKTDLRFVSTDDIRLQIKNNLDNGKVYPYAKRSIVRDTRSITSLQRSKTGDAS